MSLIYSKRVVVRNCAVQLCSDGTKDVMIEGQRFVVTDPVGGPASSKFHAHEQDGKREALVTFLAGDVYEIDINDDWNSP
jgi:hypothetical protein